MYMPTLPFLDTGKRCSPKSDVKEPIRVCTVCLPIFLFKEVRALRCYFGPLRRLNNKNCFQHYLLISLLEVLNNSPSVNIWYLFDFYSCYGNKNCRKNRLKTGNWLFWSKCKTFNRPINIEYKQMPKRYFNR